MFKNGLDKFWNDMGVYSWEAIVLIIYKYKYKLVTANSLTLNYYSIQSDC